MEPEAAAIGAVSVAGGGRAVRTASGGGLATLRPAAAAAEAERGAGGTDEAARPVGGRSAGGCGAGRVVEAKVVGGAPLVLHLGQRGEPRLEDCKAAAKRAAA